MAILNIFSKRNKKRDNSEVFSYNEIPEKLKIQVIHIIRDAVGCDGRGYADDFYEFVEKALCREYGKFSLTDQDSASSSAEVEVFLLRSSIVEEALDVIELSFAYIDKIIRKRDAIRVAGSRIKLTPDEAISELNTRFRENGIGYSFEGGKIIRVDSTYSHAEIIKPALLLLQNKNFEGANEEYLKAHEHYRKGRNKECLDDCLKAFESTMKSICSNKGWKYNADKDTAKQLINICLKNGLIPTFYQNYYSSLENLLTSGVPTTRNKLSGHGQGQIPKKVNDNIARYALNLTGTSIVFLIEQSSIK